MVLTDTSLYFLVIVFLSFLHHHIFTILGELPLFGQKFAPESFLIALADVVSVSLLVAVAV